MCDLIRANGIPIIDFNFGGSSCDKGYKNEGTRIWYWAAKQIRDSKIMVPDRHLETTKKLCAQLSSRRIKHSSDGKIWMETKDEMRARGVKSPDIADAFCMAFAVQSLAARSYLPYDDSALVEISNKHGWEYSGSEEDARREMYEGRGRGDGEGGMSGFGGVNSTW
jgi:hypothetical protein